MGETKINLQAFLDVLEKAGVDVPAMLEKAKTELATKYPDADHVPVAQLEQIVGQALNSTNVIRVVKLVAVELPTLFKSGKSKIKKRGTRLA